MGFVWAIRRSLRLLTLLTLMASALCSGQALAAQEIAAPRIVGGACLGDSAALADEMAAPRSALVALDIFEDGPAVTIASATGITGPAFSFTARLLTAPAATAPLRHHFSPPAERAPPAA